jgi:hypothetical protein
MDENEHGKQSNCNSDKRYKKKYGIFWVGLILADQHFFYGYPPVS